MTMFGIIFGRELFVRDDGEYTLATAALPKPKADGSASTINDPEDTDTGYAAELRLPWAGIGAPSKCRGRPWKMAGQEIRIMAVLQDGDLRQRYHHSSPTHKGSWFHKAVPDWPRYKLRAGPAE